MTWYLESRARAIIEAIRAEPPRRVVKHQRNYLTTDEWQVFEGPLVDDLRDIRTAAFHRIDATGDEAKLRAFAKEGNAQDVIAAVLNCPLPGTHFTCDREKLAGIAAAIDAALTPKLEDAA